MNGNGSRTSLQLAVSNLQTTEAFYRGILDLPLERALTSRGAPEHMVLKLGDMNLLFVEERAMLHAHPLLEERLSSCPKGIGMTIHIRVTNIEEIYEAILEEEMDILYPLDRKPYGIKDLWCFDPDGYLIVLEESYR